MVEPVLIWLGLGVSPSLGAHLQDLFRAYWGLEQVEVVQGVRTLPEAYPTRYILTTWDNQPSGSSLPGGVQYREDTLHVRDLRFAAPDLIFQMHVKKDGQETILAISENPVFLETAMTIPPGTWAVRRVRDGMERSSVLAWGTLKNVRGHWIVDSVQTQHPPAPDALDTVQVGRIRLFYPPDLLFGEEAAHLARTVDLMFRSMGDAPWRLPLPDTVRMFVYAWPGGWTYSTPYAGWIWFRVKSREDLLRSCRYLRTLAHEVARVVFQPVVADPSRRTGYTPTGDDWSHVAPLLITLPYLKKHLSRPWFVPCDLDTLGPAFFHRWYTGASRTYAYLLADWLERGHQWVMAEVIRAHLTKRRYPDLVRIMEEIAARLGPDEVSRVRDAFTTPLEHSLRGYARWGDIGLRPVLERMVQQHWFGVDSVIPGLPADRGGIRPGDTLLTMEGFSLAREKDLAWREALKLHPGDTVHFTVKRGGETVPIRVVLPLRQAPAEKR